MIEPVSVLRDGERPTHAILRWEDWKRLERLIEDAEEARDAADAKRILADPAQDWVPLEVVNRLLDENVHPVRVWREHREMSQSALAKAAGVTPVVVNRIETGQRKGTLAQLKALAEALEITVDTLVATL